MDTARPTGFSDEGMAVAVSRSLKRWVAISFLAGSNRYIQQESTLLASRLWERAGATWTHRGERQRF